MDSDAAEYTPPDADRIDPPFEVMRPDVRTAPLVLASPHSGRVYPPGFTAASRLDPLALRRSEDAFIDEVYAAAPALGMPLLKAHFPRAYVDPNREPWELDPEMFDGPLPDYVNAASPRVGAGLGTVARVVTDGEEIYRDRLAFAEARWRIETYYKTYHAALAGLIDETLEQFGVCVLIDCHSMPSVGGPMDADPGLRRVDFVLGDCHGMACATPVIRAAEAHLGQAGFRVVRNTPYSGGFTTRHYGTPERRVHALQIEVNRALYMDEETITRTPGLAALAEAMGGLLTAMGGLDFQSLRERRGL